MARIYGSPDPRAMKELLKTDTSALPFLARALARHLEEFPSDRDGLSRSERRMLEQVIDGPAPIDAAFPKMHEGETAHYIANSWFFDRVKELSSAAPALRDAHGHVERLQRTPGWNDCVDPCRPRRAGRQGRSLEALRNRSLARRRPRAGPRTRLALERARGALDRSVTTPRAGNPT